MRRLTRCATLGLSILALPFAAAAQDKPKQDAPAAKSPAAAQPPTKPAIPPAAPATPSTPDPTPGARLEVVAEFNGLQATGVAVSKTGRLFVSFPRWRDAFKHSLVEVTTDAVNKPYPSDLWNGYVENTQEQRGLQFVCIQSVKVDEHDRLWVLDAAAPRMEGVKRSEFDGGGPKLIEIDLATDKHRRVFRVPGLSALAESYLNDFEIDHEHNIGYITDSGAGGLILVNLKTYETKRVLERHASTKADPAFIPVLNGSELRDKKGLVPKVNADGIALDRKNGYLYYQPLIGKKLYRIKAQVLIDVLPGRTITGEQKNTVAAAVEEVDETVMTDGMIFDPAGNLYFTAVEKDAIMVRTPDGELRELVAGGPIKWPDSFAIGPKFGKQTDPSGEQYLYFTTSQIHLTDWFSPDGSNPKEPYRVLRTKLYGK